jgi:putative ABC transport system substrate-binding protein
MRRRQFVAGLGAAVAAGLSPFTAQAQQDSRLRRVGVLMGLVQDEPEGQARIQAFRQGLADLGWVESRNLHLDVRWSGLDIQRQQSDARDLVALAPEVILTGMTTTTLALRKATQRIPIVFVSLQDPVVNGVVSNLARPEANVTGFTGYEYSMAGKWLSLLKDAAPRLTRVALLFNPDTAPFAPFYLRAGQEAGERLGLKVTGAGARAATDIEPVMAALADPLGGGVLVFPDPFNNANKATIIALAAKYRVPAIYYERFFVAEGGLLSYGQDIKSQFRDGATYVDRILRGVKPVDLPVQFATKFELVINLKTAKALGLAVPESVLLSANEVIE